MCGGARAHTSFPASSATPPAHVCLQPTPYSMNCSLDPSPRTLFEDDGIIIRDETDCHIVFDADKQSDNGLVLDSVSAWTELHRAAPNEERWMLVSTAPPAGGRLHQA
eukprot:Tamp_22492.p2 GENE.Tamp_22492~~Tamp_22492.p2  ORF type:complete len:108 (-),score=6.61 Tamp_22492:41-364(-)